ncbi:MAG: peptide-methionine (R)-S-oxide reductase, partial [Planctomycetota bacterium]
MSATNSLSALILSLILLTGFSACYGASEREATSVPTAARNETRPRDVSPTPAASSTANGATTELPSMASQQSKSHYDVTPLSREQVAVLAKNLSKESFRVTQNAGTEPAFCGNLVDNHKQGTYVCVVC